MITTTLFGGLGNQMFIYAVTRAIALRNDVPMAFNIQHGFKDDVLYNRNLELLKFNISLPKSQVSTFNIPFAKLIRLLSRKIGFNIINPTYKFMQEDCNFHFQKDLVERSYKNLYLEGYWQSPKYFDDYEDIIKQDFTFKDSFPKEVEDELRYIKSLGDNLVMLGVRRYQECKDISDVPGNVLTEVDYYLKAMDLMSQKISNPVFIVFSQDQEWVKANLTSNKYRLYFVKNKQGENNAIEDLFLMINCDHYIISNSSYYWWGAWLSYNNSKIVIAPNNFLNRDTVPDYWITL